MYNPFEERKDGETEDLEYVTRSLRGDKDALESLVLRHQSWIYNIAVNMTGDMHLSEDITQEVLIKMITKLSTYDRRKAAFRTWLYRIAANHIINLKKSRKETTMTDLMEYPTFDDFMARIPDTRRSMRPEHHLMLMETKASCIQCILLCLGRKERIVFVLGAIFDVNDRIGSEICGVTPDNFRTILSRSRKRVNKFFFNNCSLINDKNPCRCAQRFEPLGRLEMIDPGDLIMERDSYGTIRDVLGRRAQELEDSYHEFNALYKSRPFFKGPDMVAWLNNFLERKDFGDLFGRKGD